MKLYRSKKDKKIFGLCGGLAEALNIDATLLRVVLIITVFFSAGMTIMIYLLASFVVPKEEEVVEPSFPFSTNTQQHTGHTPYTGYSSPPPFQEDPNLDKIMSDIEKKALQKEIEELKQKLTNYEKGEK